MIYSQSSMNDRSSSVDLITLLIEWLSAASKQMLVYYKFDDFSAILFTFHSPREMISFVSLGLNVVYSQLLVVITCIQFNLASKCPYWTESPTFNKCCLLSLFTSGTSCCLFVVSVPSLLNCTITSSVLSLLSFIYVLYIVI